MTRTNREVETMIAMMVCARLVENMSSFEQRKRVDTQEMTHLWRGHVKSMISATPHRCLFDVHAALFSYAYMYRRRRYMLRNQALAWKQHDKTTNKSTEHITVNHKWGTRPDLGDDVERPGARRDDIQRRHQRVREGWSVAARAGSANMIWCNIYIYIYTHVYIYIYTYTW